MYQMHRVFCATPWELEAERRVFQNAIGRVNENEGLSKGVLLVPVTVLNVADKRPLQYTIDENIRESRHYILVLSEGWGPPERNFRADYSLALQCMDDPVLPMQDVAIFLKTRAPQPFSVEGLPEPRATFSTPAEFDQHVYALLSTWLQLAPDAAP
jgi:hypothetical protein